MSGDSQAEWTACRVKNSIEEQDAIIATCNAIMKAYAPPENAHDFELLTKYGALKDAKMGEFIKDVTTALKDGSIEIGGFAGLKLRAVITWANSKVLCVSTPETKELQILTMNGNETPEDIIRALKSELSKLIHRIERAETAKEKLAKDLTALANSGNAEKIKDADAKIAELKTRLEELDKLLEVNSGDTQADSESDSNDLRDAPEDEESMVA